MYHTKHLGFLARAIGSRGYTHVYVWTMMTRVYIIIVYINVTKESIQNTIVLVIGPHTEDNC